jgi:hypothetical protein
VKAAVYRDNGDSKIWSRILPIVSHDLNVVWFVRSWSLDLNGCDERNV